MMRALAITVVALIVFDATAAYIWSSYFLAAHARQLCWEMVDCKKL